MPFVYFGMNAIFVFVASGAIAKLMTRIKIGEEQISLWGLIYRDYYHSWLAAKDASLLLAITFVLIFLAVLWWMYKKKIFIKV